MPSEIVKDAGKADIVKAVGACAFAVTDSNVARLYPDVTAGAFVIDAGEKSKTPETLFRIIEAMHEKRLKRGDTVAAIGGGVVGDITGLASAIYMRGVAWINVPTTLLAMIDAGIGGKTAVDFCGVKNLVGAFHEPKTVYIDTAFLVTLPEREWVCGTGELIKTCVLRGDAYETLYTELGGFRVKKAESVGRLVRLCVDIKSDVVASDPTEKGLRKILNVGHTVGHALESIDGFRSSHGEYVMKGMLTEAAMCVDMIDKKFFGELTSILGMYVRPPRTTAKAVCELAASDKKNESDTVTLMIPCAPADIKEVKLTQAEFVSRYDAALRRLKDGANG